MHSIRWLVLPALALLLPPEPHAAGKRPETLLQLETCYPKPPLNPVGMLSDDLGSVISYLLFYNHQTCVAGGTEWHRQLCGKVGDWFRWVEPERGTQTLDAVNERRRKALRDFSALVHRDPETRKRLVRELATYARRCKLAEIGAALLAEFGRELDRYSKLARLPAVANCKLTCNPGQHPRWGLGAWGQGWTNDCFAGCGQAYKQAFADRALPRFIHRRVLQGIPVQEMRQLIALARKELRR